MPYKTVKFIIPRKPTCLNFALPVCQTAHLLCWLCRRAAFSPADLTSLQIIAEELDFVVEILYESDERT